jgi:hypothetical protein
MAISYADEEPMRRKSYRTKVLLALIGAAIAALSYSLFACDFGHAADVSHAHGFKVGMTRAAAFQIAKALSDGGCDRPVNPEDPVFRLAEKGTLGTGHYCGATAQQWVTEYRSSCGCGLPSEDTANIFFKDEKISRIELSRIFGLVI